MGGVGRDKLGEEYGLDSVCRGRQEQEVEEEVEDVDVDGRPECSGVVGSALVCITEDDICRGRSDTQAQICTGEPPGREPSWGGRTWVCRARQGRERPGKMEVVEVAHGMEVEVEVGRNRLEVVEVEVEVDNGEVDGKVDDGRRTAPRCICSSVCAQIRGNL